METSLKSRRLAGLNRCGVETCHCLSASQALTRKVHQACSRLAAGILFMHVKGNQAHLEVHDYFSGAIVKDGLHWGAGGVTQEVMALA